MHYPRFHQTNLGKGRSASFEAAGSLGLQLKRSQIAEYDYSTLRRMITGSIRLQPRATELMAEALRVPPETFLEYQVFQITAALEAHPEIRAHVYRTVLTRARVMDELGAQGSSNRARVRSQPEL